MKYLSILIPWLWSNRAAIAVAIPKIQEAQRAFASNADKKDWVLKKLLPILTDYTPAEIDTLIDGLVQFAQLVGWLPKPNKTIALRAELVK